MAFLIRRGARKRRHRGPTGHPAPRHIQNLPVLADFHCLMKRSAFAKAHALDTRLAKGFVPTEVHK